MKLRTLSLILAVFFTLSTLCAVFIINMKKIRWDKVPIISFFVLEIELWPSAFDASYLDKPITWEELDTEPSDWEENGLGGWFSFNTYTKNLLKNHMKENNLGIVPDSWNDFKFTANFEDCLETFEFVELDESYRVNVTKSITSKVIVAILFSLSIVSWLIFMIFLKKR